MKRIPIKTAKDIAKKYEYDQVIIIALKRDDLSKFDGKDKLWTTTYGKDKAHCKDAAQISEFLLKQMGCNNVVH